MWGIIPAAGLGSRIQPLAFSKELLPVGSRIEGGIERPCAVSEYLLERMILAGADKLCFIISPGKSDIMDYFGDAYAGARIAYLMQPTARGLCDAIFRADCILAPDEVVLIGLPDTVWFPKRALLELPDHALSFLLFPVERPEFFDAVVLDSAGRVRTIEVKQRNAASNWIWGAFKMPAAVFAALRQLWLERRLADEYVGTLVNAYIAAGGEALGIRAGRAYVDLGTLNGYRAAMRLIAEMNSEDAAADARPGIGWPAGRLLPRLADRQGASA